MTVGINEVFDNVVKYLKRNYPKVKDISMPYCVLTTDSDGTEEYYRAEVHFQIGGAIYTKTAILKASAETGKVYWFQEGFTWKFWIP